MTKKTVLFLYWNEPQSLSSEYLASLEGEGKNLGESQGLGLGQFTDSPEPWAGVGPQPNSLAHRPDSTHIPREKTGELRNCMDYVIMM